MRVKNLHFFDKSGYNLNFRRDSILDFWEGNIYLPKVSVGLYESTTIYILEEVAQVVNGKLETKLVFPTKSDILPYRLVTNDGGKTYRQVYLTSKEFIKPNDESGNKYWRWESLKKKEQYISILTIDGESKNICEYEKYTNLKKETTYISPSTDELSKWEVVDTTPNKNDLSCIFVENYTGDYEKYFYVQETTVDYIPGHVWLKPADDLNNIESNKVVTLYKEPYTYSFAFEYNNLAIKREIINPVVGPEVQENLMFRWDILNTFVDEFFMFTFDDTYMPTETSSLIYTPQDGPNLKTLITKSFDIYEVDLQNSVPYNISESIESNETDDEILTKYKHNKNISRVLPVHVAFSSPEHHDATTFRRTLVMYCNKTSIAKITFYAETIEEDERLKILNNNLGYDITPDDTIIFRESNINECRPDYKLINKKRKELLMEGHNIFPYVGSYKALINAIKFYGYDNLGIVEFYRNINTSDVNYGKLFHTTKYSLTDNECIYVDQNKIPVPNKDYKKSDKIFLTYSINSVTGDVDEFEIPGTKESFDYTMEEVMIKLFALRNKLNKTFMPSKTRITDIVGVANYFGLNILENNMTFRLYPVRKDNNKLLTMSVYPKKQVNLTNDRFFNEFILEYKGIDTKEITSTSTVGNLKSKTYGEIVGEDSNNEISNILFKDISTTTNPIYVTEPDKNVNNYNFTQSELCGMYEYYYDDTFITHMRETPTDNLDLFDYSELNNPSYIDVEKLEYSNNKCNEGEDCKPKHGELHIKNAIITSRNRKRLYYVGVDISIVDGKKKYKYKWKEIIDTTESEDENNTETQNNTPTQYPEYITDSRCPEIGYTIPESDGYVVYGIEKVSDNHLSDMVSAKVVLENTSFSDMTFNDIWENTLVEISDMTFDHQHNIYGSDNVYIKWIVEWNYDGYDFLETKEELCKKKDENGDDVLESKDVVYVNVYQIDSDYNDSERYDFYHSLNNNGGYERRIDIERKFYLPLTQRLEEFTTTTDGEVNYTNISFEKFTPYKQIKTGEVYDYKKVFFELPYVGFYDVTMQLYVDGEITTRKFPKSIKVEPYNIDIRGFYYDAREIPEHIDTVISQSIVETNLYMFLDMGLGLTYHKCQYIDKIEYNNTTLYMWKNLKNEKIYLTNELNPKTNSKSIGIMDDDVISLTEKHEIINPYNPDTDYTTNYILFSKYEESTEETEVDEDTEKKLSNIFEKLIFKSEVDDEVNVGSKKYIWSVYGLKSLVDGTFIDVTTETSVRNPKTHDKIIVDGKEGEIVNIWNFDDNPFNIYENHNDFIEEYPEYTMEYLALNKLREMTANAVQEHTYQTNLNLTMPVYNKNGDMIIKGPYCEENFDVEDWYIRDNLNDDILKLVPKLKNARYIRNGVDVQPLTWILLSYEYSQIAGIVSISDDEDKLPHWTLTNTYTNNYVEHWGKYFTCLLKTEGHYRIDLEVTDIRGHKYKTSRNIVVVDKNANYVLYTPFKREYDIMLSEQEMKQIAANNEISNRYSMGMWGDEEPIDEEYLEPEEI